MYESVLKLVRIFSPGVLMKCDDALGEKYRLVAVGFFITHVDKRGEPRGAKDTDSGGRVRTSR